MNFLIEATDISSGTKACYTCCYAGSCYQAAYVECIKQTCFTNSCKTHCWQDKSCNPRMDPASIG